MGLKVFLILLFQIVWYLRLCLAHQAGALTLPLPDIADLDINWPVLGQGVRKMLEGDRASCLLSYITMIRQLLDTSTG